MLLFLPTALTMLSSSSDGATLFSLIEDHYWRGSLFTCPMADSYVG